MELQWIDLVLLGIIGLSALMGLFRGVIKEVFALGTLVVGLWLGYRYAPSLTPLIARYIENTTAQTVVAFVLILIGVSITGSILNHLLGFLLKTTGLTIVDKLLGMGFGLIRGIFVVSLLIAVVSMTSLPYQQYLNNSTVCRQLQPVVNWILSYVPLVLNQIKSVDTITQGMGQQIMDSVPRS